MPPGGSDAGWCAAGSKIAFTRPFYGTIRSNWIYSVNFDGTGLTNLTPV
jgi:hypothetical protein